MVMISSPTRAATRPACFHSCRAPFRSGAGFCRDVRTIWGSRRELARRVGVEEDDGAAGCAASAGSGAADDEGGRSGRGISATVPVPLGLLASVDRLSPLGGPASGGGGPEASPGSATGFEGGPAPVAAGDTAEGRS